MSTLQNLSPIEVTRTDEETGIEFTFIALPPVDAKNLSLEAGLDIKEFAVRFFWMVIGLQYDIDGYPNLREETIGLIPILKQGVANITISYSMADEKTSKDYEYNYDYTIEPEFNYSGISENEPSTPFLVLLMKEVLDSRPLQMAMSWYYTYSKKELEENARRALNQPDKGGDRDKAQASLYANSKSISSNEFGLAKSVADNLVKLIKEANHKGAIKQYEASSNNPRSRKAVFRTEKAKEPTEFIFDQEKLATKTAEKFADQLMKLKDAKVLQGFMGLIKWSNTNDTPIFREVAISDIMEIVQKAQPGNKFNTTHRREFTEVLEYLDSVSMTVSIIGEQVNTKTGKTKPVLREEKGVKLFRMVATYSVKKEFQHIPKESLIDDIHFDKSVITRFSGELFPGNSHLFQGRANVYFDSLLALDAKYDSKAILLGFQIQTRFNQLADKEKHLTYDRPFLVELCEYKKTNNTKPSQATKQIANNLNKLKDAGIISKYSGLTNSDDDRIFIYPPKTMRLGN